MGLKINYYSWKKGGKNYEFIRNYIQFLVININIFIIHILLVNKIYRSDRIPPFLPQGRRLTGHFGGFSS